MKKKKIKKILVKFPPKTSCDKDDFHPSRDAALLYSPQDSLHGPHSLVFTQYSVIFWKKRQVLAKEYGIIVCLKLLLSVEMNKKSSPFWESCQFHRYFFDYCLVFKHLIFQSDIVHENGVSPSFLIGFDPCSRLNIALHRNNTSHLCAASEYRYCVTCIADLPEGIHSVAHCWTP